MAVDGELSEGRVEARLRKTIKTIVDAETRQPELLLDGFERTVRRALGQMADFFGLWPRDQWP